MEYSFIRNHFVTTHFNFKTQYFKVLYMFRDACFYKAQWDRSVSNAKEYNNFMKNILGLFALKFWSV